MDFGSDQEGTYVCRSKNAAGVDSGIVSLRRGENTISLHAACCDTALSVKLATESAKQKV